MTREKPEGREISIVERARGREVGGGHLVHFLQTEGDLPETCHEFLQPLPTELLVVPEKSTKAKRQVKHEIATSRSNVKRAMTNAQIPMIHSSSTPPPRPPTSRLRSPPSFIPLLGDHIKLLNPFKVLLLPLLVKGQSRQVHVRPLRLLLGLQFANLHLQSIPGICSDADLCGTV